MRKDTEKPSFFVRLATVIVDKRKLIFFLYACALLFCLFSRNWVSVCNDITEYLPDSTETRQGLTLMEEECTTCLLYTSFGPDGECPLQSADTYKPIGRNLHT